MLKGTPNNPQDNPLNIKNDAQLNLEIMKMKI
jgi:hypothetical protein